MNLNDIPDKYPVTVTNMPWGWDDEGETSLQLNGIFERAQDEGEQHYVRCPEFGGELNGVSFGPKNVSEIGRLSSGRVVIVLKF